MCFLRKSQRPVVLLPVFAALILGPTTAFAGTEPPALATPQSSSAAASQAKVGTLQELQARAEDIQGQFVTATLSYDAATAAATQARSLAVERQKEADELKAKAEKERALLGEWVGDMYRRGPLSQSPTMQMIMSSSSSEKPETFMRNLGMQEQVTKNKGNSLQAVLDIAEESEIAAREAAELRTEAETAEKAAADALANIQEKAAAISAELSVVLSDFASEFAVENAEQQARNEAAVAQWRAYLDSLVAAKVVPPPAATLTNPATLPVGLVPIVDAAQQPIPGVASVVVDGKSTTVLSAETISAVSQAFTNLGKPYSPKTAGPDTFDCGGFTSASWAGAGQPLGVTPADQWAQTTHVPREQAQVGDLVFFADPKAGLHNSAIYLGGDLILDASTVTHQVGVREMPEGVAATARVTLGPAAAPNAQPSASGGKKMICGAEIAPPAPRIPGGGPSMTGEAAWGGFPNGMIPLNLLCSPKTASFHRLRCDAAAAFDKMSAAYAVTFKAPICITDSYRDYPGQVDVYARKPGLAAVPGRSNHGWAMAVDLCGGIQTFGHPAHEWMRANAPQFGFVHPGWAQRGGSKPEAWHWEFGSIS